MEAEGIHESKRPRMGMEEEANMKVVSGLRPWQDTSSRIIRVSRVSGGKDRHSKVWTAKGLRDRRVRLSVSTAIQFYDLQDRLGYDQPSKAVDWLISAAAAAIADLPELDSSMSLLPPMLLSVRSKLSNGGASGDQQLSQSKSTCSTASDTSKGSVLSLSRREIGSKAKERAREKAAKEMENDSQHQNMNNQSSFTDLLTAGGGGDGVADGFGQGGFVNCTFRVPTYSSLVQLESNPHMAMGMMAYNASSVGEHQEMQHFSFLQDHVLPVAAAANTGDYDLSVSISSSFAGINRGTLQSNSPHQHHLVDGTNLPFFFGAALPVGAAAGTSSENQLPVGFNGRLHLCCVHPDIDGERKG